ncbi:hypothetical protein Leryth_019006, partial [Lithospermum erythrorhizon]
QECACNPSYQHNLHGEIFSVTNLSTVVQTLDKLYNLDWLTRITVLLQLDSSGCLISSFLCSLHLLLAILIYISKPRNNQIYLILNNQ